MSGWAAIPGSTPIPLSLRISSLGSALLDGVLRGQSGPKLAHQSVALDVCGGVVVRFRA